MIDEQRNLEIYGYTSNELSRQSGKLIIRVCDECGRYDEIIYSSYNKNKNPDLCKSCTSKGKNNPNYNGGLTIKICKWCNKEFKVPQSYKNRKFCSQKCMGKWQSENWLGENHPVYNQVILICKHCGKEFKVKKSHSKTRIYCSKKCLHSSLEYRIDISCKNQGISPNEWNGFISYGKYCSLFNNEFKKLIRNQYHNKCFLCNKSKEDNANRKLSVHHVNYNKSCLCGSTCEFVPLCIKCHAKTNHNRQTWEDLIMNYLYPERYFMTEI